MEIAAIVVLALVGAVGAGLGPRLIARIPEPVPAEPVDDATPREPSESSESSGSRVGEPKILYSDLAATPRLAPMLALVGLIVGGAVGARIGWSGALVPWAYLVPLGVVLGFVDWRTRLLPTYVVAPSYAVVVVLVVIGAVLDRSAHVAIGALGGWLAIGAIYLLMWLVFPAGMGYGDVRFSGLIGMGLGYLGWAQVACGWYAGMLLGGLIGALLAAAKVVDRRSLPFGPFMMLGAVVGVLAGAPIAHAFGY